MREGTCRFGRLNAARDSNGCRLRVLDADIVSFFSVKDAWAVNQTLSAFSTRTRVYV